MRKCLSLLVLLGFSVASTAETGESIYRDHCSQCHGKNREGAVGPNLADDVWINGEPTPANLTHIISEGIATKGMPAFKEKLSQAQLLKLVNFIAPAAQSKTSAEKVEKAVLNEVAGADTKIYLTGIRVPKGFSLSVYAQGVDTARGLVVDDNDVVYVGSRKAGKIYALVDKNKDGVAEKVITVADNLDEPIGVTLLNGSLYVAEVSRVIRFDNIAKNFMNNPAYSVVKDDFPKDRWHGGKVIKAGPDGQLYVPIGVPCNICNKEDEPYGKIYSMNPDGSDFKIYAKGVRNSVGITWHPVTKELWFTDNGRDEMGDNMPSCEVNIAPKPGLHFGYPYCHGGVVLDPEFGAGKSCDAYVAPAVLLGPHVAGLGLAFNTGKQFPAAYRNQLFVAEHGSWNRTQKIGYRVSLITLVGNKLVSDVPFIEFLHDDVVLGRPVDVAFLSDGSMLISDDDRGRVYRVTYNGN